MEEKVNNLFTHKEKSSTVDYVIEEIKRLLVSGKLKPGDKIPSETEIAEGLGISRGSVRSAMVVFKSFGIVDIRPGDGTYICNSLNKNSTNAMLFSLLILNPQIDELTKFREKIELDIFELILNDEKKLQKTLIEFEKNLDELNRIRKNSSSSYEDYANNDKEFHSIMASNCNNIVFETVYKYVFEFFFPSIVGTHKNQSEGYLAEKDHTAIYMALKNRDFSALKEAVHASMTVWYNLGLTLTDKT